MNTNTNNSRRWFSTLYRTRIKIHKNDTPILNLSLAFAILAVLSAPWLVVAGFVIALALGYRFSYQKNAPEFDADLDEVVRSAARNVKNAVDSAAENSSENASQDE